MEEAKKRQEELDRRKEELQQLEACLDVLPSAEPCRSVCCPG